MKNFKFDWKTLDDLKGLKIGGVIGYTYSKKFVDAEKSGQINVIRVISDERGLKMLLKKRIDIFTATLEVGYSILQQKFKKEDIKKITHHPNVLKTGPLYLLFSKKVAKNKEMIMLFNNGLQKLKDSGKYDQLLINP